MSCFFFEQYIQHFDQDPTHHYNMDEHMKCFMKKYHKRGVDKTVLAFKALNIFRSTGGRRCEESFVPGYAMNFYSGRKTQRSIHMVEPYGNWRTDPHISNLSSDELPLVCEFMPRLTIFLVSRLSMAVLRRYWVFPDASRSKCSNISSRNSSFHS